MWRSRGEPLPKKVLKVVKDLNDLKAAAYPPRYLKSGRHQPARFPENKICRTRPVRHILFRGKPDYLPMYDFT